MRERKLISFERLPDRLPADRIAMVEPDIREAVAKLQRTLTDRATKLHVSGWVDDPNGITFSNVPGQRTVCGFLMLTRPDDD